MAPLKPRSAPASRTTRQAGRPPPPALPGGWAAESCSEDWGFSLRAAELGWRVGATTAVRLAHYGEGEFTNVGAWGTCATDPDALRPI